MSYDDTMEGFKQLMEDVHHDLKIKYKSVDVDTFKKALIDRLEELRKGMER